MKKSPTLEQLLPVLQSSVDLVSAKLLRAESELNLRRFIFTGTEPGVGNTMLAAATSMNIALHAHHEVVHIEANVMSPRLAGYLGVEAFPGVSELLAGESSFDDCCRTVEGFPTLCVIPGGAPRPPLPGEWAMESGLAVRDQLGQHTGLVILDAPPITESPATRTLVEWADGVVLVLRARTSRKQTAKEAMQFCEAAGTPVLGVVLNRYKPEKLIGL